MGKDGQTGNGSAQTLKCSPWGRRLLLPRPEGPARRHGIGAPACGRAASLPPAVGRPSAVAEAGRQSELRGTAAERDRHGWPALDRPADRCQRRLQLTEGRRARRQAGRWCADFHSVRGPGLGRLCFKVPRPCCQETGNNMQHAGPVIATMKWAGGIASQESQVK